MEWQPIETVPTDEAQVIVTDGVLVSSAQFLLVDGEVTRFECDAALGQITHWMPLPSPPSLEAQDVTTAERAVEPSDPGLSLSDVQSIQAEALEVLEPFASGGDWGKVKAWIVNGAHDRDEGIAAAKSITDAQVAVDAFLARASALREGAMTK